MSTKVAFVTGSNRGLGFAIVRELCKQFKGDVFLTSRNVQRGRKAVEDLNNEGLCPKFHQLDTSNQESIDNFRDFLKKEYGGVDVFVNNAAIAFKKADPTPFSKQVEVSVESNYFSYVNVYNTMLPILKPGGRVVHVSSTTSCLILARFNEERRQQFVKAKSVEEVNKLLRHFIADAKEGKHLERGWVEWATGTSKVGITSITPIQQEELDKTRPGEDVIVNACCPGHISTEMSSYKGNISPEEGADTPVFLALLPPNEKSLRGCFVQKRKAYDFRNGEYSSYN